MENLAYLNGEWTPLDQAMVSVSDRAFTYGDGIYEVTKVLNGKWVGFEHHLTRLFRSAEGIELQLPWSREEIRDKLIEVYRRSGYTNALIYLQITRGAWPRGQAPPPGTLPTFVSWAREFEGIPAGTYEDGVKAITRPDDRWANCWIKSLNLLPNTLAGAAAKRVGAYEAIFVDRHDGLVNECSVANLFAVIDGVVRTAPRTRNILWGVSRLITINCAKAAGIPLEERAFSVPEMLAAEEVFLTGTSPSVLGIVEIDGKKIADGAPGPVTARLLDLFISHIQTGEYRRA